MDDFPLGMMFLALLIQIGTIAYMAAEVRALRHFVATAIGMMRQDMGDTKASVTESHRRIDEILQTRIVSPRTG